ncbi:hypothetical protein GUITHDRAFT_137512 [Guillardia theta CCMP2712]|uniref:Uncharacterized protein n=1 Tax=Guillardia theta (strain CCMP2712) TaxID=905079 RepID=L1JGS3_GUITC|nr:hypothetical protein GUITHDRAFT_137512 [Guillardia theta CCMP2712]EKX47329.1 hypothetical protein GUITHDRAFT_137512 [Guillardia theta CCMP2712]|eukprot:XP_005834309.1 hypothetical protein GUITHDRAFT_137512 [Guillardia theta CCMP2712]
MQGVVATLSGKMAGGMRRVMVSNWRSGYPAISALLPPLPSLRHRPFPESGQSSSPPLAGSSEPTVRSCTASDQRSASFKLLMKRTAGTMSHALASSAGALKGPPARSFSSPAGNLKAVTRQSRRRNERYEFRRLRRPLQNVYKLSRPLRPAERLQAHKLAKRYFPMAVAMRRLADDGERKHSSAAQGDPRPQESQIPSCPPPQDPVSHGNLDACVLTTCSLPSLPSLILEPWREDKVSKSPQPSDVKADGNENPPVVKPKAVKKSKLAVQADGAQGKEEVVKVAKLRRKSDAPITGLSQADLDAILEGTGIPQAAGKDVKPITIEDLGQPGDMVDEGMLPPRRGKKSARQMKQMSFQEEDDLFDEDEDGSDRRPPRRGGKQLSKPKKMSFHDEDDLFDDDDYEIDGRPARRVEKQQTGKRKGGRAREDEDMDEDEDWKERRSPRSPGKYGDVRELDEMDHKSFLALKGIKVPVTNPETSWMNPEQEASWWGGLDRVWIVTFAQAGLSGA